MEDGIQISGITYICDPWITADHKASHCEGRPPVWPRCGGGGESVGDSGGSGGQPLLSRRWRKSDFREV